MDALAFLPIGFLVGMVHAVEADHIAAVAALTGRADGRRALIARGFFWGLGHTLTLSVICATALLLGLTISATVEASMELVVGAVIAGLGAQVLRRLVAPPAAAHAHGGGHGKAMAIGMMHGAAGSAGLLVVMLAATENFVAALVYLAVFGIGSILGMVALTATASYPLGLLRRGAAAMQNVVTGAIGAAALWIGGGLVVESLGALV